MSRYIRTKDGEIFNTEVNGAWETESGTIGIPTAWGIVVTPKEFIVKQADTIEELCDEFVCIKQNRTKAIHTEDFNNLVYWKTNFKFKDECDFYGAIWTEKGLIYRAKMNKKGELELL